MSSFSRLWPAVALAVAASVALLLTVLLAPEAPWRLPVAVLGGVWAPGYALLAAFHPFHREGMTELERHALGFAFGLLAAPVVGLGVSLAAGFDAARVAGALAGLTLAGGVVGLLRARGDAPWTLSEPPGTRTTLAVCAATLVAASALWALPFPGTASGAPASLALVGRDGTTASLPLVVDVGAEGGFLVEARAGDRAASGTLVVTWAPAEGGEALVLLLSERALPAGQGASWPVAVPTAEPGTFALRARWSGVGDEGPRETHAWVRVVPKESEGGA